ncbi:MAG: hypothetical protein KA436_03195 [Oligoflexales bacterium]|nr:hypothetical protein [Oligoflexales bacterium]
MSLDKREIEKLLQMLNSELGRDEVIGEIYLVGGAVMCLVLEARLATKDLDGYFAPTAKIRAAASRIAAKMQVQEDWLNDSVKGFLSSKGTFSQFLELSHLRVLTANPDYLLAMKCLAMRIGHEFHDIDDVRYLLRYLNISKYDVALTVIARYYPIEKFPQKTLYVLEELLAP